MFDEVELTDELIASVEGLNTLIESGNISSEDLDRLEKITKVNRNISTSRPIRTNYELWDLFGGAYSASIIDGHLTYQNDDTSLYNVYIAATNAGKRITKGLLTRPTNEDVFLPLKEAKIDWIVTAGAIK